MQSRGAARYGLAVSAVVLAALLSAGVWPLHERPYLILLAAVMMSAWYGGMGSGLLATALATAVLPLVVAAPIGAEAGHLAGFVIAGVLISALNQWRIRSLRAERQQREWLDLTLGSIADAVVVADRRGRVTFLNPAAERMTKWCLADAVGVSLTRVFPLVNEVTHVPVADPLGRLLGGDPVIDGKERAVLVSRDGTEIPIEDTVAPIRGLQGPLDGAVIVFRDVSERREHERARERNEQLLTDFFENAAIGLHWVGPDGRILRVNQAELDLLGYTRDEYIGRHIADFHVDRATIDDILRRLAARETIRDYEARLRRKDGAVRHVLINSNVYSEDGRFVHTRCFTRDITAQKEAETQRQLAVSQLEQEHARLEAVLQRMPGGVIIAEAPSGAVILRSQQAASLFPEASAAPATVSDYPARLKAHYREFPPPEQWPLMQTIQSGKVVSGSELQFLDNDGRRTTIRASAAPIQDAHGRMVAVVSTFDDISEHKRAEETLRFLANVSNTLAASLDYETTLARVVRLAVPQLADWCMLHLIEDESRLPRMTVAHVDPDKEHLIDELYRRYPVPLDARHGYPRVLRTGESEFFAEIDPALMAASAHDDVHRDMLRRLMMRSVLCVPLQTAGRILGAMTLVTGESGRRYDAADVRIAEHFARRAVAAIDNARLYGKVAEADRRKSDFLAVMAHELRNPLAPIRNALEVMRLNGTAPETFERLRTMMERQVAHMTRLIDDLLDLSRVTQGRIQLRRQLVALTDVMERVAESNRSLIEGKRQTLAVAVPEQPLQVNADPTRLEQVLSNLVDNASKYTPAGGRITMSAERDHDDAVVRIRDTGEGISSKVLPHVFESFTRGHPDGGEGGLGIGLTLVRNLVEMHGGDVRASSAGVGQGSEFVVRLPLSEQTPAAMTAAPAPQPIHRALRALVVDDNVNSADSLGMLIELWGHTARVAYDGPAALRAAEEFRPQVVLLDLSLPGMDGYQIARLLRPPDGHSTPRLVAITGHGHDTDRERSREAGFDHHLVKPVEPALLRELFALWSRAPEEELRQ